jgi:CRP/FNR family transcriptional regulator, cyclic AMP receptor protein
MNLIWESLARFKRKSTSVHEALKANILFQDLSALEISMIEKFVNVRNYRPGEVIFRQGEVGVGMYIIVKGSVNIYVEELLAKTGLVQSNHITQLNPMDFFGDLALVEDNGLRSASAVANEESILVGFFKPDLLNLTERSPRAGVKILLRLGEVLGARLRETTAKISDLKKGPQI